MKVPISRVVTFLTPVFAAGSAALTPWLVKYTGLHVTPAQVTALSITGATTAFGIAYKWLDGHAKWTTEYKSLEGYFKTHIEPLEADADKVDPGIVHDIEADADKVVEVAKAKLVAVLTPNSHVDSPAPVPTPATPEPDAAA